jgi:Anti-sigma-K factor rskA/Putative zinc-finger
MANSATLTCDEFLDLAGAMAVDALDASEARRVEKHAAACPRCGAKLEEFREAAAAFGAAVKQVEPPAELRRRVLEAARRTSQIPTPVAMPRRLWPRWARRGRISAAWLVAAASMVTSLMAIAGVIVVQGEIDTLQRDAQAARERAARYDRAVEVLASNRLAIRALKPMVQNISSRGMAYLDPSSGTGMLMCQNLPPIEQGHAYQVWFVRGNERVSGGLVWPDRFGNGYTIIQVPADLQSFESIGLTDEPGTGSTWPTTPRVIGTLLREDQ